MNSSSYIKVLVVLTLVLATISTVNCSRKRPKSIRDMSDEDTEDNPSQFQDSPAISAVTPPGFTSGAMLKKNRVRGPADIGLYYVNTPTASCGGFSTNLCSRNCGLLGYPVYWCYPKVCYCHYGTREGETTPEVPTKK